MVGYFLETGIKFKRKFKEENCKVSGLKGNGYYIMLLQLLMRYNYHCNWVLKLIMYNYIYETVISAVGVPIGYRHKGWVAEFESR
jgi:hypothetical protein